MFENIDFSKCSLPVMCGFKPRVCFDSMTPRAMIHIGGSKNAISLAKCPDDGWKIASVFDCSKELVEAAFRAAALVDQFIDTEMTSLNGNKPSRPAPEGWRWALTPTGKWALQNNDATTWYFPPEDRSSRAAMLTCVDAYDEKRFPTKGQFQCRGSGLEVEAFRLTRERRLDNSEWPEWMHRAWNGEHGATGSLFPTDEGEVGGTLSVMVCSGEYIVHWGNWIVLTPSGPNVLLDRDFRIWFEPIGEDNG